MAPVSPLLFITCLGLLFLTRLFYLSLTLMLGTVFNSRGLALGLPLALLVGMDMVLSVVPGLALTGPWLMPRMAATTSAGIGAKASMMLNMMPRRVINWDVSITLFWLLGLSD